MNACLVMLFLALTALVAVSPAHAAPVDLGGLGWPSERGCVLVPRDAVPTYTSKPASLAASPEDIEAAVTACFSVASDLLEECRTAAAEAPQRARLFGCRPVLRSATECDGRDCLVRTFLRVSLAVRALRDERDLWRARGRA